MVQSADKRERTADPARAESNGAAKVAQVRDQIDRGLAGDKVDSADPAAAPLGTDAEAAGHTPTAPEAHRAMHAEVGRTSDTAPDRTERQAGWPWSRTLIVSALGIAVLVAVIWAIAS